MTATTALESTPPRGKHAEGNSGDHAQADRFLQAAYQFRR